MNKNYLFTSLVLMVCFLTVNTLSAQVLLYEDFEDGTSGSPVTTVADWSTSIPEFLITDDNPCNGSQSIRVNSSGGNTVFVESPGQVVSGSNAIEVSFDYKLVDVGSSGTLTSGNVVNISLDYSIDDGTTWTNYDTIDQNDLPTADCSTNTFTLPATNFTANDTFRWRLQATNLSGDFYIYIDNFTAYEDVPCIRPANVKVDPSSISFDSADLSWIDVNNPNVTDWEVVACTSLGDPGDPPGTQANPFCYSFGVGVPGGGTGVINVSETADADGVVSTNITGLDDGTTYYVYVRAICGPNDKSAWSEPIDFQTIAIGSYCDVAIEVNQDPNAPDSSVDLPYSNSDQMDRFGAEDYSDQAGGNCGSTSNVLDGYEVVYSYISSDDDILTIDVTGLDTGVTTGVFVYDSCDDIGGADGICLYGDESQNGADIQLNSVFVDADQEIFVVIATVDSSGNPINTPYTLDINGFDCATWGAPAGNSTIPFVGAANQTLADFTGNSLGVETSPHKDQTITLQWYPDDNGAPDTANPVTDPSTIVLNDQDVYHVTQNIGTCESTPLMVTFEEIDCNTDLGGVASSQGDDVCESGSLTLSATKGTSQFDDTTELYWFDAASGGEILAVGTSYTTPNLTSTTSYWVSEVFLGLGEIDGQANPGPVAGSTSSSEYGLNIDVAEPIIINSVDVYAAGSGNITVELVDKSGSQQFSPKTISLNPGGTAAAPVLTTLTLNWDIQNSGQYYIRKTDGPALLYTAASDANFPYSVGPSASITGGALTTGSNSTSYYYFYNWSIRGPQVLCEVAPRTEVEATVYDIEPITTSADDMIVCVGDSTNLTATSNDTDYQYTWTWNDANGSNTATGATITPTILGNTTFTVEGYNPNTTCSTTATIEITANGVNDLGVIPVSTQVCSDEIVKLTAGSEIFDFNNGANGWTTQNNSVSPIGTAAATDWQIVNSPFSPNGYPLENINSPDNTDYYISVADKLGSGGTLDNYLISPSFNLVGVSTAELSFDYFFKDHESDTNNRTYFDVLVSEDQGATWTVVDDDIPGFYDPQSFQSRTVNLDEYAGKSGIMVAFNYNGSWGWWLAIDNIVFKRGFADGFVSWSPATDLYFDEQATIPYDGSPINEVYFTQSNAGQYTYTALLDFTTCPDVSSTVAIDVNFTGLPTAPSLTQGYTKGETTGDLEVTGTNLNFYIQNQSGDYVPVTVNYLLEQGTTYYVTQTMNGCESDYLAIDVELDCPQPTNLEFVDGQGSLDGSTVSVVLEWDEPADVTSVEDYILVVNNDDDTSNNPIFTTTVQVGNDFTVVNGLPLDANLSAEIYSICDSDIPVESQISSTQFSTVGLSLNNNSFESLTYYPNPVKDKLYIKNSKVIEQVELYSLQGRLILSKKLNDNSGALSLESLPSGTYFASIIVGNSKKMIKIIKE